MTITEAAASSMLAAAPWLRQPATQKVLALIEAAGFAARAVGGAVRNTLLQLPVDDIDIATPALPATVAALAEAAGVRVIPTGIEHGTVTVIIDRTAFEVTTLRRDVSTDGRRATVAFSDDWQADAERRDFTINALYCDAHGQLYDFVGGLVDLAARRVRFIGDADQRIAEDYLRILRFYRFHARFGADPIDAEGHAACARNVAGMAHLSGERLRAEMLKLLVAPKAVQAAKAMQHAHVLRAVLGRPGDLAELSRLLEVERALAAPPDSVLRLAVLAVRSPDDALALARRLRLSNAERLIVIDAGAPLVAMSDGERLYRFGAERARRMLMLEWALGEQSANDPSWAARLQARAQQSRPVGPLSGADLLAHGMPPGPEIGKKLAQAERAWIDSNFALDRQALIQRVTN